MPPRQVQKHDPFFQRLLEQPGAAGALLREHLPPEVAALLVDEPPELVPGSFISSRLRGYRTDRLFKTRTITERPVLIYTLVEHKSSPEARVNLQLLGYQCQILERWAEQDGVAQDGSLRPLPALVTLVVYNGRADWNVPLSLADATDADAALRPWLLDFRYSLLNLQGVPDARLSSDRVLRVGLMILKRGRQARDDPDMLAELILAAHEQGDEDVVTLVYYIMGDPDGPHAESIRSSLLKVLPDRGERIMSTVADQLKSEGFNKGILQGRAEGEARGKAEMLLRLLRRRFRAVPDATELRVRAASPEQLDDWSERFVDAQSLADVFGPDLSH